MVQCAGSLVSIGMVGCENKLFLADTVLDAMMGADLSKKLHTIVSSHGTSLEVLNNAMTLIQELCLSGKLI